MPSRDELLQELRQFALTATSPDQLMEEICDRLSLLPAYNWVGFYLIDKSGTMLNLGPFRGAPTPHTRIPIGQGICGAAAANGQTIVVDDVHADSRYLSCSVETQSEIVAPIFVHGKVAGEIDIDSYTPMAFNSTDREFVEQSAGLVGAFIERDPPRC